MSWAKKTGCPRRRMGGRDNRCPCLDYHGSGQGMGVKEDNAVLGLDRAAPAGQLMRTEWARLMVLLQAMQGLGKPGVSIWRAWWRRTI